MTVKELIERLKQFPDDMPVIDFLYDHIRDVRLSDAQENYIHAAKCYDAVRLIS